MHFPGSHILSIRQFERADVDQLFAVADRMRPYAHRERVTHVLDGAILGSMFFEPSTRTRISFGSAFNLLGGEVRETTGFESTAIAKGESLFDTARVLSGYSDVIAMRHPAEGSVAEFAEGSRVPVINGGDGANEHPTQALLDLYTIRSELAARGRSLDTLRVAMVGDLKFGRTVHSLSRLLQLIIVQTRRLFFDPFNLSFKAPTGHEQTCPRGTSIISKPPPWNKVEKTHVDRMERVHIYIYIAVPLYSGPPIYGTPMAPPS